MSVFRPSATALITGGASGVGLAVAQLCRRHGMKVAVVDWNTDNLARAKETLSEKKPDEVETYQVDVSKSEQWKDLREKVGKKFGEVDLLMLNAGIGLRGTWGDEEYFQKVSEAYQFWCTFSRAPALYSQVYNGNRELTLTLHRSWKPTSSA